MTIKIYKVANLIITLLFIGAITITILTFMAIILFGVFVDFPCFVNYHQQSHCFELKNRQIAKFREEEETIPQIEAFFNVHSFLTRGGGCVYKKSVTNPLEISTPAMGLKLARSDGVLEINDKPLRPGEELNVTNVFHLNPWIISRLSVKNLGLVTDCNSRNESPRIVIYGYYGTEVSFTKGLIFLLFLFGLRRFMSHKIRKVGMA